MTKSHPEWARYVRALTGTASQRAISERTGIHYSTINKWLAGSRKPFLPDVVHFARAYGANPTEALVAAGCLTPAEAAICEAVDPTRLPTDVLIAELSRRAEGVPA